MIKLIKLCFVCCLIFRATFVEAVIDPEEAYEALKEFEANFWLKELIPYDDLCSEKECITKSVTNYLEPLCERNVFKIVNAKTEEEKSQPLNFKHLDKNLDFSETNLGDVIFNFYRILSCKVAYRDNKRKLEDGNDQKDKYMTNSKGLIGAIYFKGDYGYLTSKYKEKEIIDPYPTKINIGKECYHLHLNYSGNKSSKQPGNCCLKQEGEGPQNWIINAGNKNSKQKGDLQNPNNRARYNLKLSDDRHYILQNLLLCLEVSRRRVVDSKRANRIEKNDGIHGFKDIYCNLPILGAIVIGVDLINAQRITRDDFFAGDYRCFSDKRNKNNCRLGKQQRATNIKNLLLTFLNYKEKEQNTEIQTADQFKEEVQELYRVFIGQKITDRIIHPTTLTDFLNDENICKSLKKRGFSFDVLKNSILSEKLKKIINRIEVPSNNKKASNGKGNKYKKNNLENTSDKFLSKQNNSKEAKNDSKTENDESIYIWCFKENTTKDSQGVSVSLFENGELGPSFSRKKYDYRYYRTALFRITGADNVTWLYLKNPELNSKNKTKGEIYLVDVH